MQKQQLASEGTRKGPSAVQPGSCGKIWANTEQRFLEEKTIIRSEIQPCNFRNIQYEEIDGPRGLCSRLHNFYSQWLRPEKHTKAQMLDLVVLEKLLALLPPLMANWLRECGTETSSQAVALAEGFLLSQAEEQKEQVEFQTRDPMRIGNPSISPQELFSRRIYQESTSQDISDGKNGTNLTPFYGGAERVVEVPTQVREQGLVSFEEVAVYFSEEEWSRLYAGQKALHREVMLENHRNVASLDAETRDRQRMQKQRLASEGTGNGPSAVQPGSCGKIWAKTEQKFLEEKTIIRSEIQPCNFRNIQYEEIDGPRGLSSRLHNFYSQWLRPEKHTKAQMLDLVVLEQLLSLLPPLMANWLWECGAETSSQAVALAEGFLLSQAEEQKEQVEFQTRDPRRIGNPSNSPQELFSRRIYQDISDGKNRTNLTPFYGGAERVVEVPTQVREEGLVFFEEVAVYFSEEEWSQLYADQKALHREVMLENHRNVASLDAETRVMSTTFRTTKS